MKNQSNLSLIVCFVTGLLISCSHKQEKEIRADVVLYNANIYTLNESHPDAEAVAIKSDTFLAIGSKEEINIFIGDSTKQIDLGGAFVFPGFIEGHAHIMGLGYSLLNIDLRTATSYEEMIDLVVLRAKNTPKDTWIIGRGWHQEKWQGQPEHLIGGFPTHDQLSEAVPNHPVYLKHASGHAALANTKAMELADLLNASQPNGGEIIKDLNGLPTGMLNETAQGLITKVIPKNTIENSKKALEMALNECFKYGITGFHQAGSGAADISLFEEFAAANRLRLRLYVMLNGRDSALLDDYFTRGKRVNLYDNRLTIRSLKLYADGALGSRGAWLLKEYSDAPNNYGHNITPLDEIARITSRAYRAGFQVCIHAIGDRANREVLNIYEKTFRQSDGLVSPKEARFRIEHAQHFHPDDIPRLNELGVIPAMQAIHMSSDRPWAIDRLGLERIEQGAYVWQDILKIGVKIVNGTDAPVEPIHPLACFYASVSRKTLKGQPTGGYEPAQKMSRMQALKSYTLDAAYGAFLEESTGSIEVGKWADLTILDRDIMSIPEMEILNTKVTMTLIGGEIVYNALEN